jgi:hypothetical protein
VECAFCNWFLKGLACPHKTTKILLVLC